MARRPLSGDVFKITDEVNKTYEGSYAGNRQTDTGHTNPDGTVKLSTIHTIDTEDGPFSFWGFTAIDNILRRVKKGTYLWITYKGKVKAKVGQAHSVAVEFDDETGGTAADDMPDAYPAKPLEFDPEKLTENPLGLKKVEVPF